MNILELKAELDELWKGSGYQIKSIKRYLEDIGCAFEKSEDSSIAIYTFNDDDRRRFVINVTVCGYEILTPVGTS